MGFKVHFLAALVDKLMRKMITASLVSKPDLDLIEEAVAKRITSKPRSYGPDLTRAQ